MDNIVTNLYANFDYDRLRNGKVVEHLKYDNNNPKNNKSKNKNNVRSHWGPGVPGFKNAIQLSRKPITTDTSSAAITPLSQYIPCVVEVTPSVQVLRRIRNTALVIHYTPLH